MREEVVGDQVDPDLRPVAHPDQAVEGKDLLAAFVGAHAAVQAVGVDVAGAERVAHSAVLAVGLAVALGPFALGPPGSLMGISWIGPISSKHTTTPPSGHSRYSERTRSALVWKSGSGLHFHERVRWCETPAAINV